ncbi:allantoicase [Phenylobacterium sp.]|uniref:allantoicase n=1 Tax=Phenylobacterium sp. TaxID=1871053 RepID=UPI002BE1D283|nr:allantoicase [Phenylobacterium sp.]HLZ76506.1 allantoicase [Phenylobacterium sp.]
MFEDLRRRYVDLAQPRLGSEVVYATDDFFADKARLIDPAPPVWREGVYDDNGKWMDGWESRRKRVPGHDWCVIRLGVPGEVAGFEIDTAFFTGNYPPGAMIEVCNSADAIPGDAAWTSVTPRLDLAGDNRVYVPVEHGQSVTHVRLHIYPDGGIARLRVWGRVLPDWAKVGAQEAVDLLAVANGGRGVIANDEHYGAVANLTAPGRGVNMGDGWETRRRREPGHDWAVLELGALGRVRSVAVDTAHFKGNYPDRCSIQASASAAGSPEEIAAQAEAWPVLLPEAKLAADAVHEFRDELADLGPVKFVRLNIFPDGGVSRLRVVGTLVR